MMTNNVKRFIKLVVSIPANGMEEWYVKDLIELGLKNIEDIDPRFTEDELIDFIKNYKRAGLCLNVIYKVGETISIKMNNLYSLVFDVDKNTGCINKCYLFSPIDGNGISD